MRKHYLNRCIPVFIFMLVFAVPAAAKIDFAALTRQQSVQTTIYKNADLTLVRDKRVLSFMKGINRLQFSWANTRIDPTSLTIEVKGNGRGVDIVEITYPPGSRETGIWHVKADKACRVPVEITYFTSGISWSSIYTVVLSEDLQTGSLVNHVTVNNHSGEDYADAQTRLVVGKVNILDRISELARRQYPYGRPLLGKQGLETKRMFDDAVRTLEAAPAMEVMAKTAPTAPKKIEKEGLSEYFLYTIEGRETIPDGWSKRLRSFKADQVAVKNLYRYEADRFGQDTVRFLVIKNDRQNRLGTTPLPGGKVNVFQTSGAGGHLDFVGTNTVKYIPVGKEAELNLGSTRDIRILPKIMNYKKSNISFDDAGAVNGFDEIKTIRVEFSNFTDTPVLAEYTRNMDSPFFTITGMSHPSLFEKEDQDTIKFTMTLAPGTVSHIDFTLTSNRGERKWQQ